jgi:hypothetical protein
VAFWPNVILIVAVIATAIAVAAGFVTVFRGGNPARSQQLMRWRVGLQFFALLAALAVLFLKR